MVKPNTVVLLSIAGSLVAGCASRAPLDIEDLPPTAAGSTSEHIIDNSDVAFYTTGEWATSTSVPGYEGQNYIAAPSGIGDSVATWNLNIIKLFDVYAKWTSHPNRGSNVKYVIHHLDASDNLVTETVTVDQRQNGGEWFKLGTYRMSALTGRVTTNDETDGYVIADAILFREVDTVTSETDDTDGDGLPDEWELQYGLDPNDPSDASLDTDGDGLTNKDEFLLLTNPTNLDSDQDGMPDGFETDYGLDPAVDDAGGDLDGDAVSNYDEYIAGSAPNDETSMPSDVDVVLTWETPTERTDGTPLTEDEIAQYEILYQKSISSEEIVSDNESSEFVLYGSGGSESSSVSGYQGSNYFAMPAGSGELLGEWNINQLTAGVEYEVHANWTSHSNRASNAKYQYTFIDNSGSQITETVTVDQRTNGGSWQQLGTFESADSALTVSISNNADGYVIADAIRVNEAPPAQESIIIEADGENRYAISGLAPGNWEFTIRAIDTDGLKSELSNVAVKIIE